MNGYRSSAAGTLIASLSIAWVFACPFALGEGQPDWIFHNAKIVTVDEHFRIMEAMAVSGDRIVAVGPNEEIMKLAGPSTQVVDLQGRMVLPGLIDSHSHPPSAAVYEFDHEVPSMESIADVLAYIRARAAVLPKGEWIVIQQVFVTRLKERRFPTRKELDEAAPEHPVMFRTGPDAALNSLALKLGGIDRNFQITDGQPGFVEKDPVTGEPTGILRSCTRLVKVTSSAKSPSEEESREALRKLLRAYNEVGLTSIVDRSGNDRTIARYKALLDQKQLTCRIFITYYVDAQAPIEKIEAAIDRAVAHPLHQYNPWIWVRGLKFFLDGGMLTGSAYMREPWGVSQIYGITDPDYRGVLFVEPEKLYQIVKLALAKGLQPTAHAVGDGAVLALAEAYARVNRDFPVRELRPCISHANFMSPEAIALMAQCGIVADLQPAWLYHDGATLVAHFGLQRLRYFQPYRTLAQQGVIVGGGSDHMQKIGRRRSINIYDPWLGMWTVLTRRPRGSDAPLHPEEIITREEAIKLYTINNAYLTFEEKLKGSLEPGKYADFIIIDRDILTCPVDAIADTEVLETWVGGRKVFP
ncbi:Exoenzymes regulatory protein AepA precursor [Thermogutta terrifontis]|uniref:Exoenzymes regulatory protein AepA n=1 Tax=Thermogutta terrifontis TaxID=1331910 RepID=A0A286RG40_9BACT|nr:amidohydrolase [Thermogutta terrifontis]ASV74931.1 Exoenzymes regulatory protein AepA precursor [Thermogutta terrifontis]